MSSSRGGSGVAGLNSEQGDAAASSGQANGGIINNGVSQQNQGQSNENSVEKSNVGQVSNESGSRGLSGNKE